MHNARQIGNLQREILRRAVKREQRVDKIGERRHERIRKFDSQSTKTTNNQGSAACSIKILFASAVGACRVRSRAPSESRMEVCCCLLRPFRRRSSQDFKSPPVFNRLVKGPWPSKIGPTAPAESLFCRERRWLLLIFGIRMLYIIVQGCKHRPNKNLASHYLICQCKTRTVIFIWQ